MKGCLVENLRVKIPIMKSNQGDWGEPARWKSNIHRDCVWSRKLEMCYPLNYFVLSIVFGNFIQVLNNNHCFIRNILNISSFELLWLMLEIRRWLRVRCFKQFMFHKSSQLQVCFCICINRHICVFCFKIGVSVCLWERKCNLLMVAFVPWDSLVHILD